MRINAFARCAGLAIVFAAVMAFAFAAETSECAAADTVTDGLTIRCGTGHEEMAEKLTTVMNEIEVSALDYQKISARRWNTNVYVSYPDTVTIGQMRNAVTSYLESISTHTIIENDELLWRTEIGLYPVEVSMSIGRIRNHTRMIFSPPGMISIFYGGSLLIRTLQLQSTLLCAAALRLHP